MDLHWYETLAGDGEVLVSVDGDRMVIEGRAPGPPPLPPETTGTAAWTGDGVSAEIDWRYSGSLAVDDVRVTMAPQPPLPPIEGRASYQSGSTRVDVAYRVDGATVTITDVDIVLLSGVDG